MSAETKNKAPNQPTDYWMVIDKSSRAPVAMFIKVQHAQAYRNEHFPDAKLEKFGLIIED